MPWRSTRPTIHRQASVTDHEAPTRRLAVLGSPIAHSRSPILHRTAYELLGLDWDYQAVEVTGPGLASFIAGLDASWQGLSLTMPLKQDVLPLLATRDELTVLTGAANTVRFRGDENGVTVYDGFNTDVAGIVRALAGVGVTKADHVVLLGGGSTARSALVAAAQLGAENVVAFARSPERAESLRSIGRNAGVGLTILPFARELVEAQETELTISTLPGDAAPVELVEGTRLVAGSTLLDVAYHPWPSALAQLWDAVGNRSVSGLSMLVQQALLQIRIFVAGDPFAELPDESRVLEAMHASVGLDENGVLRA
jgi:shikimate dehydrogenase